MRHCKNHVHSFLSCVFFSIHIQIYKITHNSPFPTTLYRIDIYIYILSPEIVHKLLRGLPFICCIGCHVFFIQESIILLPQFLCTRFFTALLFCEISFCLSFFVTSTQLVVVDRTFFCRVKEKKKEGRKERKRVWVD